MHIFTRDRVAIIRAEVDAVCPTWPAEATGAVLSTPSARLLAGATAWILARNMEEAKRRAGGMGTLLYTPSA